MRRWAFLSARAYLALMFVAWAHVLADPPHRLNIGGLEDLLTTIEVGGERRISAVVPAGDVDGDGLDDLLIRGSQVSFRPERQRLYFRAQTLLSAEVPWIPVYVRLHWAMAHADVRNLRLHPSGSPRLDRVWLDQPGSASPALPGSGR